MGDFLHFPSNTYINLSENDLINHQLERLFEGGMEEEGETIFEFTEVVSDEIDEVSHVTFANNMHERIEVSDIVLSNHNMHENIEVMDVASAYSLNMSYTRSERNYSDWKIKNRFHSVPQFTSRFCPKISYSHKNQPIDFFSNLFPDDLINIIVTETNRYAIQENSKNYMPTTQREIKAFLGVIIMMGLHPLPDFELYWSTDRFYNNPDISSTFSLTRFKKILENLHVNDNTTAAPRGSPNFDKLHKLRPLIEKLNFIFSQQAEESTIYSVDKCMVKFKGRSSMKQYMPMKPIKRGYKVWARCDAKTGYLYAFEVYTSKSDIKDEAGLGFSVVTSLCKNLPRGSLVVFDNFFTSCKLIDILYQNNIYAIGTVRKTRKGLPEFMKVKPKHKNKKLEKHQFYAKSSKPITAIKWLDTKEVCVLSSAHKQNEITMVMRTQKDGTRKEVPCPKAIADYT
ncbi:piggyBac transposable element-derived protein 4-like [Spodoptera litura]|uniref:PiggyBac transposable element-derived protein 4-like n=1 Tax=Spodoptera litura TaxID=69820 RepID=A0A9J7EUC7_SPOLT|nr:piggyBac transposable element-derived protein 4-like [Spodoptera litura]